ncbi:unnamed protein product [Allacma fusca]|uniref:SAM domain-containing protein n=1 Tax=Allacma fusca TaxID=39272 RepID=A0A8J2PBB0_9HEXA|nr:unnamed protein product [Allacma fusca]
MNVLRAGNNSITTSNNGGNGTSASSTPNGIALSKSYGSNPQLSSKSPLLTQKQFSPVPTTSSSAAVDLNHLLESKGGKDSSKLFHTKTYNHIKDMISSRFGAASANNNNSNNSSNNPKAVNNNNSEKSNSSNVSLPNGPLNNSSNTGSSSVSTNNSMNAVNPHTAASAADGAYQSSNPPNYGLQHHHMPVQNMSSSYTTPNGTPGTYYAAPPPTQSPNYPLGLVNGGPSHQHHQHGMMNGAGPPNSYRSPPMNDRKNVNTSFRKAIQKSTQKSNLADDSVPQMRPIMESNSSGLPIGSAGQNPRDMYRSSQYNNSEASHQQQQQQQQGVGTGVHIERAQRALDKLCENGPITGQLGQFHRTGSGSIHPHSHQQQQQQQQQQSYANNRLQNPQYPSGSTVAAEARSPGSNQASSVAQQQNSDNLHSRHKFNTKAGLGSPSSGLAQMESAHSVSYSKTSGITNEAFQGNDEYNDQPPPLPSSQHPGAVPQQQQDMNTVGLPVLVEKRENGDGSSGTTENTKNLLDPSLRSSDQLKQITAELQNLAMSVSAEQQSSSSECEKGSQRVGSGQSHTTTDSGHGTVLLAKSPLHSSDPSEPLDAVIGQRQKFNENVADSISSEIRQILEMERASKPPTGKSTVRNGNVLGNQVNPNHGRNTVQGNSAQTNQSYNQGSRLHHPSQDQSHNPGLDDRTTSPSKKSPIMSPKLPKFDLNNYGKKAVDPIPGTSQQALAALASSKTKSPRLPTKIHRSNSNSGSARLNAWSSRQRLAIEKGMKASRKESSPHKSGKLSRTAMSQILYSLHDDNGDITSTTTGLDLESMLDGPTENTSDDDDLSTTIDTTDAHAIRRQLESLESMYTEVLKVLGARKLGGNRYSSSDLRNMKRRPYGSMSSLPSSVSSRPFREKKKVDDKKKVKDLKSINRRFQRLESHVVTLARSVAHLSSEMRTQHLMVQEMESIRNEMSQLRNQVVKASMQNHPSNGGFARVASGRNGAMPNVNATDWSSFRNALPSLTNPSRVRKLTKFFGDEPPLIRIFLKKLGYEKYASAFEQERIGIMELPYLTEDRLNKMGIPMGPRLRILQEAHMCLKPHHHDGSHQNHHHTGGNLSVYVV